MSTNGTTASAALAHMKALIEKVSKARAEYARLAFAENSVPEPAAPCTEAEMAELEKKWDMALPQSYRLFLSACNGWLNFDLGGMDLLSANTPASELIDERIESFKEWERAEGNVQVERCLFIGAGRDSSDIVYLDPDTLRRQENEMDVVHSSHDDGEIDRFPDFFSFLEDRLALFRELIADEQK